MIYERPARKSSYNDPENRAAQRLGRALAAADITVPDRYQRLQNDALAYATANNGIVRGVLTEDGMNLVSSFLERAVR